MVKTRFTGKSLCLHYLHRPTHAAINHSSRNPLQNGERLLIDWLAMCIFFAYACACAGMYRRRSNPYTRNYAKWISIVFCHYQSPVTHHHDCCCYCWFHIWQAIECYCKIAIYILCLGVMGNVLESTRAQHTAHHNTRICMWRVTSDSQPINANDVRIDMRNVLIWK